MIKSYYYISNCFNASHNLALEEYFFERASKENCVILYLWQNDNTIVIGKNQNAYDEFDKDIVKKNKTSVVRRMTGGGAVYHDLGNLNFTFIAPKSIYNKEIMFGIIINALKRFDIKAFITGRNDIFVDKRKVSGNAYYLNDKCGLHHGTLLINTDLDMMNDLLNVPDSKIAKRGVKSVKSKVDNLVNIESSVSVESLKNAIYEEYNKWSNVMLKTNSVSIQTNDVEINRYEQKYDSLNWNFDNSKYYKHKMNVVYPWGNALVVYNEKEDVITEAKIYTDSIILDKIDEEEIRLIGTSVNIKS